LKLGVFGGTFDPPHIGHLVLAESAREQLALDMVLWIPAGDPWRKQEQLVTAANHRVQMVKLAIEGNPAFELKTVEVEREGPSYTVETLQTIEDEHAGARLFLLLGEDALADMPNWRSPEEIARLSTVAVAGRGQGRAPVASLAGQRPITIEMPAIDVSSTAIREKATAGQSIRYQVPAAVERYIQDHRLYASNTGT
jgi:nicotinate-nucleotide adenylyltransferase